MFIRFGRMLLIGVVVIIVLYIGFMLVLYLVQSELVYYPNVPGREISATPAKIGLDFERVELITRDCIKLTGWFIPATDSRAVLLFCHGNAGNISHRLESIRIFNELGLSVLIFDYRGYGESGGKPSEQGTYLDAEAAWEYLINVKQIFPEKIVVFGRSLGGPIAAWLAYNHTPRVLILESTFTSLPALASEIYPYFPVKLLCRFSYDTQKYLKGIKCPLLIIHSTEDDIVSFEHARRLFDSANEPKNFFKIGGGHIEGFSASSEQYEARLDSFISHHLRE